MRAPRATFARRRVSTVKRTWPGQAGSTACAWAGRSDNAHVSHVESRGHRVGATAESSPESLASLYLAAPAVGRNALVRQPDVRRQRSGLPEHIDRHSAARGPVAADAQVGWLENRRYAFADYESAFLVKVAVAPEGCEIKLQR